MMRLAGTALLFTFIGVSPVRAQTDFGGLTVMPGDKVHVTQPSGVEVSGIVTEVTPAEIKVAGYAFTPEPGLKIARAGDSIWTGGTLIGAGIGAGVVGLVSDCFTAKAACMLAGAAVYGGIGALIDYFHEGRTTVFRGRAAPAGASTHVAPVVSGGRTGIIVSVDF